MKARISTAVTGVMLLLASALLHAKDAPTTDSFNIADYEGQIVYVDFWASWCTPCRASFPFMAELAREHGAKLAIVAINVDEARVDADQFLAEFDAPFDIVYDPQGTLASLFKVPGMPTSYLFDRNGNFIERHIGFRRADSDKIRASIKSAVTAVSVAESDE